MKRFFVFLLLLSLFLIPACKNESGESPAPTSDSGSYRQITQEEAKRMMALDDGHIILDVRREDEYDSGHIPGAVLLPNEEIGTERPAKLPKLDQIILVYCRSGRRSKEAAEKLAKMGYTQIYEFGGILTWDGEIVTTKEESAKPEKTAQLRYSTFSGGGPEYSGSVQDPSILSFQIAYDFGDAASEVIDGASYDVIFTLIGLRPGETLFTVSGRSPIAGNFEILYHVTVSKENTVEIEELSYTDLDALVTPVPVSVVIEVNGKTLYMDLEENPSANDFFSHLSESMLAVELRDTGTSEKIGDLPWELVRSDASFEAKPGDLVLYEGCQIAICCEENTTTATKLGRIDGKTGEELLGILGEGDATAEFWIEWSE